MSNRCKIKVYLPIVLLALAGSVLFSWRDGQAIILETAVGAGSKDCAFWPAPTAVSRIIYITEKEINQPNGYVIKAPGLYKLRENVNWFVKLPDSFAITIACNDVTFEGDSHFIKQLDTSKKHVIAIQVKEGVTGTKIENLILKDISGGGIRFCGKNAKLVLKGIKTINCGYFGLTSLDPNGFKADTPRAVTQGILLEGSVETPIKDAEIRSCTFVESGILRSQPPGPPGPPRFETNCGAIGIYHASDVTITGCAIDGCAGRDSAYGITLVDISNVFISDNIITDIVSRADAQGLYQHNIDGELKDTISTAVYPHVAENRIIHLLDTHGVTPKTIRQKDSNIYPIEVSHLKNVIPKHKEHEQLLFDEHTWKEFRTLERLVCHNSDKKSRTSGIYAKWVELFCDRVLGVKVTVKGGFANLYPTGNTPLPSHRDEYGTWVCSLSFGETRTFQFVRDANLSDIHSFTLESGDVFLFSPSLNETHEHRMLPEPTRLGRRINLTYFLEPYVGQDSAKLYHTPSEIKPENIPTFEEAARIFDQTHKTSEKPRVIFQDEKGNYYEEINGTNLGHQ